jgi:hypothetical protein
MKNELRELSDRELDLVSGGSHHSSVDVHNFGANIGIQVNGHASFDIGEINVGNVFVI